LLALFFLIFAAVNHDFNIISNFLLFLRFLILIGLDEGVLSDKGHGVLFDFTFSYFF
jgi:hypothetical protein